ncbi:hypothetical protein TNCV_495651 [Trichonephila clavipes]|nr:hypothetical protein TNCV_495651 [Trichonephila clavipes]
MTIKANRRITIDGEAEELEIGHKQAQKMQSPKFFQDNARPHVAKTVRDDFCSSQHLQLLPSPAYSRDMSPIEHVWDLVGRLLARDPRPAASKDELLQRMVAHKY